MLSRSTARMAATTQRAAAIRRSAPDAPVAVTERVVDRLLAACGLRILSPTGFAVAIEDGEEPSARDTARMNALLTDRRVRLLIDNVDTRSTATAEVRRLAARHGVEVVEVHESMPADTPSLTTWVRATVAALARALGVGA